MLYAIGEMIMAKIDDIGQIIRNLIETNEKITSVYDTKLLCKEYEKTKNDLKELCELRNSILKSLKSTMNEFFNLNGNVFSKKFNINTFRFIPSIFGFEYRFYLPKTVVDKTSNQYFCYINLMEKLVREYDSISKLNGEYVLMDITASLDLKKLLGKDYLPLSNF